MVKMIVESHKDNSFPEEVGNETKLASKPKRIRKYLPGVCEYCNKWFGDKRHLYAHKRIHTGEKPFECNVCHKAFNQSSNLRRHLVIHSERTFLYCDICGKEFLDKQNYNMHMEAHTGRNKFACHICNQEYSLKYSLKQHMRKHTEGNFICNICQESFAFKHLLDYHKKIHYKKLKKSFPCTLCKRVFSRNIRLQSHLQSIHNIRVAFQCKICNERFPNKKLFEEHYPYHKKDAGTNMPQEEMKIGNKSQQDHESNVSKNTSCDETSNASKEEIEPRQDSENRTTKNTHLCKVSDIPQINLIYETEIELDCTSNITEDKYPCEAEASSILEKKLISETKSEQDFESNVTIDRYLCGICLEEFNCMLSIQKHLHTHSQEVIFACDICKESFTSECLLKEHSCVTNTDVEMVECYICEEKFDSKNDLKEHLSVHIEKDAFS